MTFKYIPVFMAVLFLTGVWLVSDLLSEMPEVSVIEKQLSPVSWEWSTLIVDHSGTPIGEIARKRRYPVSRSQIPEFLRQAFLAAEDQNFYDHGPLSFRGIVRAALANLRNRERSQGASTITQQLARNLFLTSEKTWKRKILETGLAFRLEEMLNKDEILNLYMNRIYLGRGAWGVEAAARIYLGKSVSELNLSESALIAALPKAPSALAPHRNPEGAMARRNLVLARMKLAGFINNAQYNQARQEVPGIVSPRLLARPGFDWVVAQVRKEMKYRFAELAQRRNGLKIETGISASMASELQAILSRKVTMRSPGRKKKYRLEAAHICIDVLRGMISCLQGGVNYRISQFDRVSGLRREIHSLSLPFLFSYALNAGASIHMPFRETGLSTNPASTSLWDDLRYSTFSNARQLVLEKGPWLVDTFLRQAGFSIFGNQSSSSYALIRSSPAVLASSLYQFYRSDNSGGVALIKKVFSKQGEVLYEKGRDADYSVLSAQVKMIIRAVLAQAGRDLDPSGRISGLSVVTPDRANAWFMGEAGGHLHVIWAGAEFGRTKIAATYKRAQQWWDDLVVSLLLRTPGHKPEGLYTQDGKVGYRRFVDSRGISRTLPFRTF